MSSTALLFSGQGAQVAGMGRDFADTSSPTYNADALYLWKKAENISGLPLREIYWDGSGNALDDEAMADTRALQPALTVVNITLWQALASRCDAHAVAGHSLGEYAALAAARVLDIETVLQLVSLRGRLMAEADPDGKGSMAAVLKLDRDVVQDLVQKSAESTGEELRIANYNTPAQYVISGAKAAVHDMLERVKAHKGRAIALKVSGAFHSPLMAEAAAELAPYIKKADFSDSRMPVYCNVHGRAVREAAVLRQCLVEQMTASVLWIDTMQHMWVDAARRFVEIGPKAVLAKMVAPCLADVEKEHLTTETVSTAEQAVSWT